VVLQVVSQFARLLIRAGRNQVVQPCSQERNPIVPRDVPSPTAAP